MSPHNPLQNAVFDGNPPDLGWYNRLHVVRFSRNYFTGSMIPSSASNINVLALFDGSNNE
jgi:hypothetical protein